MKKNIHLALKKTTFCCVSCNFKYVTQAAFKTEDWVERIGSCINCNHFYTGTLASEMKVGAVERFRERSRKVKSAVKG